MDSRCFMFDLVIINVYISDFDYENSSINVEVKFNETEFTIESNPEKVGEFKQGRTIEFKAYQDELKIDLLQKPLKLKVKTNTGEIIDEIDIFWPQDLLNKLENDNFLQYSNFNECDLKIGEGKTGRISFHYRLRAKCELSDSEDIVDHTRKRCDIQNELKRIVNTNDILFLIQNDSDVCSALNEDKVVSTETAVVDLSKFKNLHGKVVQDTGLFDRVYSLDCCNRKCGPEQYQPESIPQKQQIKSGNSCRSRSSMQWACKATKHVEECPHSDKFSDNSDDLTESSSFSSSCECTNVKAKPKPRNYIFENGKMKNICFYPQSQPALKESVYVRPKLCPICKRDVSWLPKLAACPNCGHKPVPYTIEKAYDENLTAEKILEEWAVDTPKQNISTNTPKRENRCSCKNGKVCAYCRIRKICEGILKKPQCSSSKLKTSAKNRSSVNDFSVEKICKSSSQSESRTHLARVFSELKDLYNIKTETQKNEFECNELCEKNVAKPKPTKLKKRNNTTQARKNQDKDKEPTNFKKKFCRRKIYNYKTIRKYPGTLVGHKTCVASGKFVPSNMGWLWNADTYGQRSGWKPGAIRKPIKELMKYFLKDFPLDSLGVSKYSRKIVKKKESEELIQKETLHVCKKSGAYIIRMRPLKDATLLKKCPDPYVPMKPICFKIVKNPLMLHTRELKSELKRRFDKCTCHKPISYCFCRSYLEKKRLEFELNKACRQRGIRNLKDSLVLSDTSDSETEFDFGVTPPAGVIKPQLKNKPDLACRETQYKEEDWLIKPVFPKPLNKYMKTPDKYGGRKMPVEKNQTSKDISRTAAKSGGPGARIPTRCDGIKGGIGGWGGIGGNYGSGPKPKPLFCNLARRAKAIPCCPYPRSCTPCVPIC